MFGYDLGIDLGTTNIVIGVPGKGIRLDEPAYVAYEEEKEKVLYAGKRAYFLEGREPEGLRVERPILSGVVGHYELAQQMMRHLINKVIGNSLFKPRVVVSVPAMHTDVEKRTIVSVMIHAGARSVCLVEEPLCAAFGAGIDPMQPSGAFVIDLGGGTVDMAVISQGAMSQSESLKVGGNDLDAEIVKFLREEHNVAVGLRTAEEIKRTVACALPREEDVTTYAKGQDLLTGLPREVEISGNALYLALQPYFETVAEHAGALFERTSPQLVTDIGNTGVLLTGGGANICNMDRLFSDALGGVPVRKATDEMHCVAKGCVVALEKMHLLDQYGYRYQTKEDAHIR